MSALAHIQKRILETDELSARYELALAESPSVPSLGANIQSLQKIRKRLEQDFVDEANAIGIEVCRYRIFGEYANPNVKAAASTLTQFQALFSTVYDAVKNGPKLIAKHSTEALQQTAFSIGYSFQGSLGLALTIPREHLLFPDLQTALEDTIHAVFDMVRLDTTDAIRDASRKYGLASIRAIYKWADDQVQHGLGSEIEWRGTTINSARALIQRPQFARLRGLIDRIEEVEKYTTSVVGKLISASVKAKTFELETVSGNRISGKFQDAINEQSAATIPMQYAAKIAVTKKMHFSTGQESVEYLLLELAKPG